MTTETGSDAAVTVPPEGSVDGTFKALRTLRMAAGPIADSMVAENMDRASNLELTLGVYERTVVSADGAKTDEPLTDVVTSLLTDLRHLVGLIPDADFDHLVARSEVHFVTEGGD